MTDTVMTIDTRPEQLVVLDPRDWIRPRHLPNFLSAEECQRVKAYWDDANAKASELYTSADDGGFARKVNPARRVGNLCWFAPYAWPWFADRLLQVIWDANTEFFGLNLTGLSDSLQLAKYLPGDFFCPHRDAGIGKLRNRKLSFTVQLSDPADYDGGELEIFGTTERHTGQGTLTVFPSIMLHEVKPVTRGERWSLVSWVSGSEWR